jgi:DNA primase catalytic core
MFLAYRQLDRIKALSLPEIISSYGIPVRHSGNSSYQALCPFHNDTSPSLSISFKGNIWLWHCFGCGSKGTVIDFVMRKEGLSFKEAYRKLSQYQKTEVRGQRTEARVQKREEIVQNVGLNPQELLNKVADFYHSTFKEDRRGLEYLAKRGISEQSIYLDFKLGFVNGSLKKTLPDNGPIIDSLKQLGLLNERGNEHFYNCVVFPIFDEDGNTVSFYGRSLEGKLHLYLAGPHRGVFNSKVLRTNKRIFLTESIIDALSLCQVGLKETISLYGTNGLTQGHIELFQKYRTGEIYLCLDNDEAGKDATLKIAERLAGLGIKSYQLGLPEGIKDLNDYLLSGKTKDDFRQLLEKAVLIRSQMPPLAAPCHSVVAGLTDITSSSGQIPLENSFLTGQADLKDNPKITQDDTQITFDFNGRSYRIRGLTTARLDQLRVNIKLATSGSYHLDTLDLYNAKSRQSFVSQAKRVLNLEASILNQDLSLIVEHLEDEQAKMLEKSNQRPVPTNQLTEQEKEEALGFLKSPDLFERILADFKFCGYVGEEMNLLLGYITAISRRLQEPLATLLVSRSASGKSTLQDAVLSFTPPEDYEKYTRLTDQALFYKEEDALKHKLLAIEEEKGASGAGYSLRNLQSAHGLRIAATIKDPQTGKLKTDVYKVSGPTAIMITTTYSESFDYETYNRFIILTVDESIEQTRLILERQRLNESIEGLILKRQREKIRRLHHNVQRLLKPLEVANPYSDKLTFIDSVLRARREQPKYLAIIKSVALLRQYQKEIKSTSNEGEPFEYIEVDLKDVEIANSIANQILGRSLDEMSPPSRRLLIEIKRLVDKLSRELTLTQERCIISRRDIREFTKWSDYQVRTHIRELEELEYLVPVAGCNGKRFTYQLVWDGQGQDGSKFMLGLLNVEKLQNPEGKIGYPEHSLWLPSGAA